MASTFQSVNVSANRPAADACAAGEIKTVRGTYAIGAALVVNDLIQLVKLPPEHVPVDCIIDADDLDTDATPAIVLSAGVATAYNNLIATSTIGQAGGMARLDQKGGNRVAPATSETIYGVKVQTGPATGATTGTIGMTMSYRHQRFGA